MSRDLYLYKNQFQKVSKRIRPFDTLKHIRKAKFSKIFRSYNKAMNIQEYHLHCRKLYRIGLSKLKNQMYLDSINMESDTSFTLKFRFNAKRILSL